MPDPVNGILDDFNRADENPLSGGGNWPGNFGSPDGLQILSNQAANVVGGGTGTGDRYWLTNFNADQEVFATQSVQPTTAARGITVAARIQNPAPNTSSWDGYILEYFFQTVPANADPLLGLLHVGGSGASGTLALGRVDNGVATRLITVAVDNVVGARVWMTVVGTTLTGYLDLGSGFEQIATATDATYNLAGFIGLRCRGQQVRGDDFGGGNV